MKRKFKDDEQFYQFQQKELSPFILIYWIQNRTNRYDVGNRVSGLG